MEHSLPGAKVQGTKVPRNESSMELSLPGAKVPGNESSRERKFLGAKVAVTKSLGTVGDCFSNMAGSQKSIGNCYTEYFKKCNSGNTMNWERRGCIAFFSYYL